MNRSKQAGLTKKQVAYEGIKNLIVEGEFAHETPLVERQLCDILQVSRTPVREALRELAAEGMVEVIDGKGVYVKRPQFKDMIEIFELREALEGKAVRLFVERINDADVQLLKQYMELQEEAYQKNDHKSFMDIDMNIHMLISAGAKNGRLEAMICAIYSQIRQMAISVKDDKILRDQAVAAHRTIIEAIVQGDAAAAQNSMMEHITEVKEYHKERYYLL